MIPGSKPTSLPPAPVDRTGWPWTEESPRLPDTMPDGKAWPRISIVTPSYNQGQFIEETIRSVLLQSYPALEYIIIDGGSTDNTVEIIEKYSGWLTYWISEPDRGQSHAINKGFAHATGDIFGWLNSDDFLLPGALGHVARCFSGGSDAVSGNCVYVDEASQRLKHSIPAEPTVSGFLQCYSSIVAQPSTFWSRRIWEQCGPLSEALHYCMDYNFFLKVSAVANWMLCPHDISAYRRHAFQKTGTLTQNHYERPAALDDFGQCGLCARRWRNALQRAKRWEGWLTYWQARMAIKGRSGAVGWLMAPVFNWRCLLMGRYYAQLGRAFWHRLKAGTRKLIARSTAATFPSPE